MIDPDKPGALALSMLAEFEQLCRAPAPVDIDLREESRPALDPEWEWIDVTRLGDPPWIRRYAPGRRKGPR